MARAEDQIRAVVSEFVRALEPVVRVQKVILYGSYASGQAREESDNDPDNAFAREIARTGKVIYQAPGEAAGHGARRG
jgi:predicted nucleotidyltransferase